MVPTPKSEAGGREIVKRIGVAQYQRCEMWPSILAADPKASNQYVLKGASLTMGGGEKQTRPLTPDILRQATTTLCHEDSFLRDIVSRHGVPPLWPREPGFATLARIILEQQVSLSSARQAYRRVQLAIGAVTPGNVLRAGEAALLDAGITRQKTAYLCDLADHIRSRRLDLKELGGRTPESVRETLQQVKGIGRWTSDIYLMLALRYPDIWPLGDLALIRGLQRASRPDGPAGDTELNELADRWKPYRSVAARILWHDYLTSQRMRTRTAGRMS